jgi:plastocyanin
MSPRNLLSCLVMAVTLLPAPAAAQQRVSGRLTVRDRGGQQASDAAAAVVWLTGPSTRPAQATRTEMVTEARQFRPRLLVVPIGSAVVFPNHDPFNHNIFSTQPVAFDLGLFGRGEGPTQRFDRPGLVRLFCNIHPRMSGIVLVLPTPFWIQPGSDGSFVIEGVPPGRYQLHAWHERAGDERVIDVTVPASGSPANVEVTLDASGYRYVQHLNKYGRPYGSARERY